MESNLIISFVSGASGKFIANIINYVLYDNNINVIDDRGAAHGHVDILKNGWWLNNLDFLIDYHTKFIGEIDGYDSPNLIIRESLRHAYLSGSDKEVAEKFSKNYSSGVPIIKTHCSNLELIQNIATIHKILPLILLIEVETEQEYNHCLLLARHKNRNTLPNTEPTLSFSEYSTLTKLYNHYSVIKFPVRHILNQNVSETMNMFIDVITNLNSKISDEKLIIIQKEVVRYFKAQQIVYNLR